MHTLFWIRNLQVRGPLGRPRCEWRITLITRSKLWCRTLGPSGSSHGPVTGILQYGNEPPPSIKKKRGISWSIWNLFSSGDGLYSMEFSFMCKISLYNLHFSLPRPCYISHVPIHPTHLIWRSLLHFTFAHACYILIFPYLPLFSFPHISYSHNFPTSAKFVITPYSLHFPILQSCYIALNLMSPTK